MAHKALAIITLAVMVTALTEHNSIFVVVTLRNEFNFWNVQGTMNTSGLLQS